MQEDGIDRRVAVGRRCILLAALLWSLSGVLTKLLGELDGPTIALYRGLFAGLVMAPLVPRASRVFRWEMVPLGVVFGGMTGFYVTSITQTTAANAIFLQYSSALWTIPASYILLRERPNRRDLLGSLVAMTGVLLIVIFNRGEGGPNDRLGIALGLASGLCYGLVAVGMRGLREVHPMWLSAVNNLGGSIVIGIWLIAMRGTLPLVSPSQAVALAVFGVAQMAIPYALFARGLRSVTAPEAGLLSLIEPVLNPIWVLIFVGERPELSTLVGGAFLLGGVAVRFLRIRRPSATRRDW